MRQYQRKPKEPHNIFPRYKPQLNFGDRINELIQSGKVKVYDSYEQFKNRKNDA